MPLKAIRVSAHPDWTVERIASRCRIKDTGCWEWQGGLGSSGYCTIQIGSRNNYRQFLVHRFSFAIAYGEVPTGQFVLHSCDNPPCCNPAHLSLGSAGANMADRDKKGRQARGERQGFALLTADTVRMIRDTPESNAAVAARLGVSPSTVSKIRTRVNWKHVA